MKTVLPALLVLSLISVLAACKSVAETGKQSTVVTGDAAGAKRNEPATVTKQTKQPATATSSGRTSGAPGSYVIASGTGSKAPDPAEASQAVRKAQENPATVQDAVRAMSADLNNDGYMTLDEVVAMKQAGFTDEQMVSRLRSTDQRFQMTAEQEKFLRDRGVSQYTISQMEKMDGITGTPTSPRPTNDASAR